MANERNSGIDMLRLVLMYAVCMMHVLWQGGILYACKAESARLVYFFLETLAYCATDAFALISGYMAKDAPLRYEKLVEMWFRVFFYSFVFTLILSAAGVGERLGIRELIKCALPVTSGKYWYFSSYFVLFLSMPVLNRFIFGIDETAAWKALILIIALFSLCSTVADPFIINNGYSAIWLIALYVIGALSKRVRLFEKVKSLTLVVLFLGVNVLTWAVFTFAGSQILLSYVSPTVLLSALIAVILFSRLNIKGTLVSKLSPLAFGVYLFHLNQVFFVNVILNSFAFVADNNVFVGVMCVFAIALAIFIAGLIVDYIRGLIFGRLRIPALSRKIVCLIDKCLTKLTLLIK